MSLATFKGGLVAPFPLFGTVPAFITSLLIDATAEKVEFVFQVPRTGTLDKVEFRTGAVTFPASTVLRVSFQDLAAGGDADGTQDQYRDITSLSANTWTVPGLMTSDGTDTGSKRSVTEGQFLSVVWEYSTFQATASIIISALGKPAAFGLPYVKLNTGSWTNVASTAPILALKYDDGTYEYVQGVFPVSALNAVSFASNSTPDERGLYFQVPFPCRIRGAIVENDAAAAGRDFDLVLYQQGNNTPLATLSVDGDYLGSITLARGNQLIFASRVTLAANTNYRLVVKPTTTSNVQLYDFDVNAAGIMDCFDFGQLWHYTTRTDGATTGGTLSDGWTQTTTKRPLITPIFDQFDDGVSTGGRPEFRGGNL